MIFLLKRIERKGNRMEGTEVFRKYNSAVFMVFTSDGRNTYQGSGFFINAHGLAVSNYHVFEGTGMGIEQIKLTGSDVVYKVATVIHKSSDSDFILLKLIVIIRIIFLLQIVNRVWGRKFLQ